MSVNVKKVLADESVYIEPCPTEVRSASIERAVERRKTRIRLPRLCLTGSHRVIQNFTKRNAQISQVVASSKKKGV